MPPTKRALNAVRVVTRASGAWRRSSGSKTTSDQPFDFTGEKPASMRPLPGETKSVDPSVPLATRAASVSSPRLSIRSTPTETKRFSNEGSASTLGGSGARLL